MLNASGSITRMGLSENNLQGLFREKRKKINIISKLVPESVQTMPTLYLDFLFVFVFNCW